MIDGEKRTGNYICLDAKYLRGKPYGEQMNAGRFIHSGDNIILVDGVLFEEIFEIQRKGCTFVSTYKVNPLKEIGTSAPTEVLFSYLNGGNSSLSLRDFVAPEALRHPSPPAAGRCKALKNKSAFKQA
ncbi:MAG: hypothetical protein SPF58_03265 [Candidatus Cryptobacteroides sp.]|uniref:hypothetical protein n=1 Tax=Candidatus Cryptobacteroides sp. TaxID=2952915 RepID=UPI002A90928A|nr:hypothetical protein [Candidatus Cryptobacteroides sp.]MDY5566286.1 hypothetical protein [Candidatus Cryptobacteroides sp.]